MNIANQLTISRIILAVICVVLIIFSTFTSLILGLIVFITASLTDLFDGYFARKRKIITDLGKILDPISDKVLMLGAFFTFALIIRGYNPAPLINIWFVILIAIREILITCLRLYYLNKEDVAMSAKALGKIKTVLQLSSIIYLFIIAMFNLKTGGPVIRFVINIINPILMSVVVFMTLLSGAYYLWRNRTILKEHVAEKKQLAAQKRLAKHEKKAAKKRSSN
ncbi:MAG: CDP-diacylglycerol--glycerol-3-phosphate 3-phosphatidyltransferase [Candidatus Helarchaeota archaeon]